jgi:hypothetical protein
MVFIGLLLVVALLIGQTADLGGRMVFFHGVGMGKKAMTQQATQAHEHGGREHGGHEHGGHEH